MRSAPEISAPEIKGWCPTALRPMQSGDGLLMRVRTIGSTLLAEHAIAIADVARSCGNGLLDLSQRAQLQMRGLQETTVGAAQERLAALGLVGANAVGADANIVVSPLAEDANVFAQRLSLAASHDAALHGLPGKFLFLIDDGSTPGLVKTPADIRLEFIERASASRIAISVDGAPNAAVIVAKEQAIDAALALARAFLALRAGCKSDFRRMRAVVEATGIDAVGHKAGLDVATYVSDRRVTSMRDVLGAHCNGGRCFAGVAAPLGRWDAATLEAIATIAATEGNGELRLTPWRVLLLPTRALDSAQRIAALAAALGLIVDADDPRLSVVACPGAPECSQARGVTRAHLDRLAPLAKGFAGADGVGLHLSGCAKGCARRTSAPLTAVATDGGFDLIDNGCASDESFASAVTFAVLEETLVARAKKRQQEPPCPAH